MKALTLKRSIGYSLIVLLPLITIFYIAKDIGLIYILVPIIGTALCYYLTRLLYWLIK